MAGYGLPLAFAESKVLMPCYHRTDEPSPISADRRSGLFVRYDRLLPQGYAKALPQIRFDRFDGEHLTRSSVSAMGMQGFPETFTTGARRVGSAQ